jgi:hypothetical protein
MPAQAYGRRLEHDAVIGEIREERRALAALGGHARERQLRIDKGAECNFFALADMRVDSRWRHADYGERACTGEAPCMPNGRGEFAFRWKQGARQTRMLSIIGRF